MDAAVGRLMDELDALDVAENTLVIFFGDNGAFMFDGKGLGVASSGPLRHGHADLHEGGIRVPAFVRWPGQIRAGSIGQEPLTGLDVFPLIFTAAGLDLPDDRILDGYDPTAVLTQGTPSPHENLFWAYRGRKAMRSGRYKLVQPGVNAPVELYDLYRDIGETTDLSAEMPDVTARLKRLLDEWDASMESVSG